MEVEQQRSTCESIGIVDWSSQRSVECDSAHEDRRTHRRCSDREEPLQTSSKCSVLLFCFSIFTSFIISLKFSSSQEILIPSLLSDSSIAITNSRHFYNTHTSQPFYKTSTKCLRIRLIVRNPSNYHNYSRHPNKNTPRHLSIRHS